MSRFVLPDLPVTECLPRLLAVLGAQSNAVLVAPPGAGKTTCVPLALLDASPMDRGRILMLEPRRLAARAAAGRMASLIGEKVGRTVGFRTRLESAVSAATRIEVITTGLLVRRLLRDPGLEGVSAVLLDEIHERVARGRSGAGAVSRRPGDAAAGAAAARHVGDARQRTAVGDHGGALVESAGRAHPVQVPLMPVQDLAHPRDLPEAMARAIRGALSEMDGDILAFLPGMAEIRRTETALGGLDAAVLALHGDLPPAEQDLTLRPSQRGA